VMESMSEHVFWFLAMWAGALAIAFAFRYNGMASVEEKKRCAALARGQELDDWLICALIWAVVLSGAWEGKIALESVGALVLAWTAWRTLRRLARLGRR